MIAGFGCPKLGLTPFHEWKRNRILHFIYKAYIKMRLSVNFKPLCASFWNDSFKHLGRHKKCANHFFSLLYVERIKQFSCHFEVDTLEMKLKCLFLVSCDCRAEQYDFCISEKLGTHINAPSTYLKNNQSVDRIPLHFLVHLPSE